MSVAFHPSGAALASGDFHGAVRHWDLAAGTAAKTFDAAALYAEHRLQECGGARVLAFSADGALLAVAGTRPSGGGTVLGPPTVLVYDWSSGELRHTLALGADNDVYVCDLRFHPDGFLMAVTSGQPGGGKLVFRRVEDDTAFFETTAMLNCHSLSLHPAGRRLVVAATSGGSNGNGRVLDANGEYLDNHSPLHVLDLPA
jgi:WD40 repeat protein